MFDLVLASKKTPHFSHSRVRSPPLLVPLVLLLSGCGGGGSSAPSSPTPPSGGGPSTPPAEEAQGLLIQIAAQTELAERAKQGFESFLTNAYEDPSLRAGADDLAGGPVATESQDSTSDFDTGATDSGDGGSPTETVSFTGTYTLEAKVDEYDVVKYNGERLFIAPTRGMDCCFVFEDTVVIDDDGGEGLETGGDEDGASNEGASTCLLYTSPSPRDRTRSRMPSSA